MFLKKKPTVPERRTRASQSTAPSSAVFSYHANRSIREGSQYRDHDKKKDEITRRGSNSWQHRLPNIAILVVIVIVAVFCMQLSSQVHVQSVGAHEGQLFLRDQSIYTNAAKEAFRSLINSNKLTVNTDKISQDLRKRFPELQTVSVSLPVLGNKPTVYIQPATPKLLLVTKGGMFVLDSNGRALIPGNQVAKLQDLGVPVVNDQSGLEIAVGKLALPRNTVAFITEVTGQLQAKKIVTTSLVLPPGTNEFYVTVKGTGYTVKYNLYGNAREEVGAYLALKERLEAERKIPKEYIDVRVENKAYYK